MTLRPWWPCRGSATSKQNLINESVQTRLIIRQAVPGLRSTSCKSVRETTLQRARSFIALDYDEAVAERLGDLLAAARTTGRRAGAMDAIIAVTAVVHDLTVWTQDNDFETLAELLPALRVLRG